MTQPNPAEAELQEINREVRALCVALIEILDRPEPGKPGHVARLHAATKLWKRLAVLVTGQEPILTPTPQELAALSSGFREVAEKLDAASAMAAKLRGDKAS